jgi:hypothetical protein
MYNKSAQKPHSAHNDTACDFQLCSTVVLGFGRAILQDIDFLVNAFDITPDPQQIWT